MSTSTSWVEHGYAEHALYDEDEIATESELRELEIGSVVVTYLGEGSAWIKVGPNGFVSLLHRENFAYDTSKRTQSDFMVHRQAVVVWQAPERPIEEN